MASLNAFKKLGKNATDGQKKIEKPVREQRAYAKGQVKAAGATALTAAALSGMTLTELRKAKREAETEAQRARIQAAIEKTLREMSQEKQTMKGNNTRGTSPKPRLRPQKNAKGGMAKKKKYNKGGYAKCGASYTG
jgi:uncharacterized protein YhaN